MKHAADMRGVIVHAELLLDQPTDPRASPQVRGQPRCLRSRTVFVRLRELRNRR